jgi:hypothetical protein
MICLQARAILERPPPGELPNLPLHDAYSGTEFRQSVDLETMQSCRGDCRKPDLIHSAGPGLIRFRDDPEGSSWLQVDTGLLLEWRVVGGRGEVLVARCREGSFTPFALSGRERSPGLTALFARP